MVFIDLLSASDRQQHGITRGSNSARRMARRKMVSDFKIGKEWRTVRREKQYHGITDFNDT
jgi:hypothetical protein